MTAVAKDRDVLLVFPGRRRAPDPQIPLQLLHVASALTSAGYRSRVADLRLGDFRTLPLGDPVFVGITAMSGPQIRYGLEFADRVRAERPGTPIVWGGVHPTLLPEQTAVDPRVDVVVRGEGELVVGPLADALAAGEPLDGIHPVSRQPRPGGQEQCAVRRPGGRLRARWRSDRGGGAVRPDHGPHGAEAVPALVT